MASREIQLSMYDIQFDGVSGYPDKSMLLPVHEDKN